MRTNDFLSEPKISQLDLLVTEKCNLKCVYCFHKARPIDMTDEVMEKAIEMLLPQFRENVLFNFFGGEPILMEHFCIDWMHKLREILPKCRFHFTTNGTVYSERLVEDFLKKEDPIIQISHDGINHARLRGEEELVTRNLKRYIDAIGANRVTARLTFTNETAKDLYENAVYFYNLGARRFAHQADVTNEWTEGQLKDYCSQLDKVYEFIESHSDFEVVFCDCKRFLNSNFKNRQCSMGRELMSLSANGELFPCHRAVKFPEFKIGDVWSGQVNRGKFPVLAMDGCSECEANTICHQCFLANYEHNGFLEIPVESGCLINKYEYSKLSEKFGRFKVSDEEIENVISVSERVLGDVISNNKAILGELSG
jgi:uncharacterized protein